MKIVIVLKLLFIMYSGRMVFINIFIALKVAFYAQDIGSSDCNIVWRLISWVKFFRE